MATRKNIMLGTAGHVDHGKTALVRLLTGCETDTLAAEKERGLTIELGFAPCTFRDDRVAGIVDVPGHVDFIRNMVAGAQGVDVVIFVVAADDGVMPQTREHLDILTLMGVRRGLVALTKIDLVDAEMRELATEDVREFLAGTFLESAPICPISNITGEGFEGLFDALNATVDACDERPVTGLFRMWIERTFTIRGFGTVASGIPATGEVRLGQHLRVLPGGQVGRVRRMEVYGQDAEVGRAGECVAMNLTDVDLAALRRGQVLVESPAAEAVEMFEAELTLLPAVPKPMKDYAEVHLHVGTADAMAHAAILDGKTIAGGESRMVQMRLTQPLGVAPGERFVVRAGVPGLLGGQVTTVGGGRVLDVSNIRLRRNRPWTLEVLAARRDAIGDPAKWAEVHLSEAATALTAEQLAERAQMRLEMAAEVLAELRSAGKVIDAPGGRFAAASVVADVAGKIAAELEAFHAANPKRLGMEIAPLREKLAADPAVFNLAVARLLAEGKTERAGDLLALAGRQAKLSPADAALCDRLAETLSAAGLAPPSPDELIAATGEPPKRVAEMLRLLAERGTVVNLDPKVVMHADAVAAAKKVAVALFARAGAFNTMEFRDALGVSRKYAVPLLDYFDTVRLTVRSGNRRTPGAEAKKLL